jgi:hypothetical protein
MQKFWGLRGNRLNIATMVLVVMPSLVTFAYNSTVVGGVLTSESFVRYFPDIDTVNSTGSQQHFNSTIQGTLAANIRVLKKLNMID